jgi:hypothetical protein
VKELTCLEAERLAIYFEESGAYQHKQMKQLERDSSPAIPSSRTVLEIGDDEEEYDDYE